MNFNFTEEQTMLKNSLSEFSKNNILNFTEQSEKNEQLNQTIIKKLAQLGYCGICTPTEFNGAGFDTLGYALAIEEISKVDAALGLFLGVTSNIIQFPLIEHGSDFLQKEYLTKLAEGIYIGGYSLSESLVFYQKSETASLTFSKKNDHIILNGTVKFVSNAALADVFLVYARNNDIKDSNEYTAFLIDKKFSGLQITNDETTIGLKAASHADLLFNNYKLPIKNIVGEINNGIQIASETENIIKLAIASQALGIAEAALELAINYSKERIQFGRPIAKFEAIQIMLSEMKTDIEAARFLVYHAAWLIDQDKNCNSEASSAKLFASEMAFRCVHKSLQIHGGYGYMKEYPIERIYRDQKITEIYGGSSEIQHLIIAASLLK